MPISIKNFKKVTVVGGGIAGWLTALVLQKSFAVKNFPLEIEVLESPDDPIIGVGEATLDSFPKFLHALDIPIPDFVKESEVTFKNGILFQNWNPERPYFFHPYFARTPPDSVFYETVRAGLPIDRLFISTHLARARLSPCESDIGPTVNHGFHFNTAKFAAFLTKIAKQRGIKKILTKVTDIQRNNDGSVEYLKTSDGQKINADFYFDCSGFRSILLSQTKNNKFISYSNILLNDRALAGHIPYSKSLKAMPSFTRATAMKHGWRWTIPVQGRYGVGYVYSSQFVDDEVAEREFRQTTKMDEKNSLKKINMNIGHYEKFMFKNTAAIGLSGGFIEPLESSGILFITHGLVKFVDSLFENSVDIEEQYNAHMASRYKATRDFVAMHFTLAPRNDTDYWKELKVLGKESTSIQQELASLKSWHQFPVLKTTDNLWRHLSYLCILDGMGALSYNGSKKVKASKAEAVAAFALPQYLEKSISSFKSHQEGLKLLSKNERMD